MNDTNDVDIRFIRYNTKGDGSERSYHGGGSVSLMGTARGLLGKNVEVTLGIENGAPVIAKGQLLSVDEWGEVTVRDEMGGVHWCWPMLDIREAS